MPRRSPGPDATVPPSMLWPLLCSALLVGIAVTGDVIRAYSRQRLRTTAHGTGAFGAARSTDEPHSLQRARGGEPGRGRHARAPWHIPWKGWKDIFWRTYQQIGEMNHQSACLHGRRRRPCRCRNTTRQPREIRLRSEAIISCPSVSMSNPGISSGVKPWTK